MVWEITRMILVCHINPHYSVMVEAIVPYQEGDDNVFNLIL